MFPPDIVYLPAIDKQVMSAGCIPVIIARDYVKPFPEEVDWPSFSFTFSPEEVPYMLRTLRSIPPKELIEMQVTRSVGDRKATFCCIISRLPLSQCSVVVFALGHLLAGHYRYIQLSTHSRP